MTATSPPTLTDDGDPACPVCMSPIVYVEHSMTRREYPVTEMETDSDPATGARFVLPLLGPVADERDTEVLTRRLDCAALDCDWTYAGEALGEAEYPL